MLLFDLLSAIQTTNATKDYTWLIPICVSSSLFIILIVAFVIAKKKEKQREKEQQANASRIAQQNTVSSNNTGQTTQYVKQKSATGPIIFILFVAAIIIIGIIIAGNYFSQTSSNKPGGIPSEPSIFEREATNNDIEVEFEYDFPFNVDLVVYSYYDIDSLILEVTFFDKNNKKLNSMTKYVGDIKEGERHTVSINVLEQFIEAISTAYTSVRVYGGTVSYIQ